MYQIIHSILKAKPKTICIGLFVFAIIIRLSAYMTINIAPLPDANAYLKAGYELINKGYTTNYKIMPLYPIWAYLSNTLFHSPLLDLLISAATAPIIYLLSLQIFNHQKASILAALIFSIFPLSVFYSINGLSENLFVFLFLYGLYFAYKKKILLTSLFWVLSILVRPSFDYLYPILIFIFIIDFGFNGIWPVQILKNKASIFKGLLTYLGVYVFLMAPWWIHNYNQYGQFVRLNLGFGQALYEGNNAYNQDGGPIDISGNEPYPPEITTPLEINAALTASATNYITNNPQIFFRNAIKKGLRFWNPLPNHSTYQKTTVKIVIAVFSLPLYICFILFFLNKSNSKYFSKILPILLIIGYLTLVHMITVGSIRYRFPLEPLLIIVGSFSCFKFLKIE